METREEVRKPGGSYCFQSKDDGRLDQDGSSGLLRSGHIVKIKPVEFANKLIVGMREIEKSRRTSALVTRKIRLSVADMQLNTGGTVFCFVFIFGGQW